MMESIFVPILKVSESESVRTGWCQNFLKPEVVRISRYEKFSEPESVRIWKCQNLKGSEPDSVRIFLNLKLSESQGMKFFRNRKVSESECVRISCDWKMSEISKKGIVNCWGDVFSSALFCKHMYVFGEEVALFCKGALFRGKGGPTVLE